MKSKRLHSILSLRRKRIRDKKIRKTAMCALALMLAVVIGLGVLPNSALIALAHDEQGEASLSMEDDTSAETPVDTADAVAYDSGAGEDVSNNEDNANDETEDTQKPEPDNSQAQITPEKHADAQDSESKDDAAGGAENEGNTGATDGDNQTPDPGADSSENQTLTAESGQSEENPEPVQPEQNPADGRSEENPDNDQPENSDITESCGDAAAYRLITQPDGTQIAVISGTGAMWNYLQGQSPFYRNTALKEIVIEDGITSLGDYAFEGCSSILKATLANTIESVGKGAFLGCDNLNSIALPPSVTTIGANAFSGCPNLPAQTLSCKISNNEIKAAGLEGKAIINHSNLKQIKANPATCNEPGNTAYSLCQDCGAYFSDPQAANEISQEETVIEPTQDHVLGEDGVCQNCGVQIEAPPQTDTDA